MDETYKFYPFGLHNPYITKIISHEDNTLIFDGYFYVDVNDLPIQRIMLRFGEGTTDEDGNTYQTPISNSHIEIYEKISGEDTSSYDDSEQTDISGNANDDSGDENICFFPTEITTLKYRVLKSDLTKIEHDMIIEVIKEQEKKREEKKIRAMLSTLDESED